MVSEREGSREQVPVCSVRDRRAPACPASLPRLFGVLEDEGIMFWVGRGCTWMAALGKEPGGARLAFLRMVKAVLPHMLMH